MNSKRTILIIPFITLVIGAVILLYGYWERAKVVEEIENLFTAHVDSVASLVKEGADEAATSTALMYDLTEEHLLTTAHLFFAQSKKEPLDGDLLEDKDWLVRLALTKNSAPVGEWGPIPESTKAAFLAHVIQAEPGEMVDDGPAAEFGLLCLLHAATDHSVIICRDAKRLSELRRETGIGPLLKGVIQRDVLYAALQDADGILAAAPSIEFISQWNDDPTLKAFLSDKNGAGHSRLRQINGRVILEGLIPFQMADESSVVLRVGIDAAKLLTIQANANHRFAMMAILVIGIFFFATLVASMAWRWQSKREAIELEMASEQERKNHWETIGQMAATVAHEVRNPLNTVNMAAQRLGSEFTIAENEQVEFDEMVGLLRSESARVGRVVTEFLSLGKPLNLNLERVDITGMVNEALAPMSLRAASEGKELALNCDCNGSIMLDRARFQQMMANLVDNALDAISTHGKVAVNTKVKGDGLVVEVSDNGQGLDRDQIDEVMKPFVSFKSAGTGLGLPLVKRLVQAHGGTLELASVVGQGTTARIFLPRTVSKNRGGNNDA